MYIFIYVYLYIYICMYVRMYFYIEIAMILHMCYTLNPALSKLRCQRCTHRSQTGHDPGPLFVLHGCSWNPANLKWHSMGPFAIIHTTFPTIFPHEEAKGWELKQIKAEAWGLKPNVLGRLDTCCMKKIIPVCKEHHTSVPWL